MTRATTGLKMSFADTGNSNIMNMIRKSTERRQHVWSFLTRELVSAAPQRLKLHNSMESMDVLDSKTKHRNKTEAAIFAMKQAAEVAAQTACSQYLLAQQYLREADARVAYQKQLLHWEMERRYTRLATAERQASLHVGFDVCPHQLQMSHALAPSVPRVLSYQKSSQNVKDGEKASLYLKCSQLNDTKEHFIKISSPTPDTTLSTPLPKVKKDDTVGNSTVGKKRSCPYVSQPELSSFAQPRLKRIKKGDYPDDMPQRPLSSCMYI